MGTEEEPGAVRRKLPSSVRAGLDLARAVAAVYVVVYHVVQHAEAPRALTLLFSFGQEAVIVFFLLSGFVIFTNEATRVVKPGGYYLRRLRRIYPPIVLAMLVSTGLWAIGVINLRPTLSSAIATLLSLQDTAGLKPGVVSSPYLGNDPLWSLSYEVFFYLVFPLVMVLWRRDSRVARLAVPVLCCAAYSTFLIIPNHFSLVVAYFMLWWVGAMAARAYQAWSLSLRALVPEFVGLMLLTVIAAGGFVTDGWHGVGQYPGLMVRHFAVGLIFLVVLTTPVRRLLASVSARVAAPAAAVASISYGLYVMHYPLLVRTDAGNTLWLMPLALLTIALAWIADRGIPRVLPRAPRA